MFRSLQPDTSGIAEAARILEVGGLVGFPTETVYGLGADGLSQRAVERIFEAKGRPPDNPLILHVSSIEMAAQVTKVISDEARILMSAFWPGPLTLVLERNNIVPSIVSAGLDTVAVRMPRNEIALALIRALGRPIAAPSANISGRPSPTKAAHVAQYLGDKIDALIDGGDCSVGVESTVVDARSSPVRILRPGAITVEDMSRHSATLQHCNSIGRGITLPICNEVTPTPGMLQIGRVTPVQSVAMLQSDDSSSPGTRHAHYQPRCGVRLFSATSPPDVLPTDGIVTLTIDPPPCRMAVRVNTLEEYAQKLYDFFHQADARDVERLFLEIPPDHGIGRAIMDRISRAAGLHSI